MPNALTSTDTIIDQIVCAAREHGEQSEPDMEAGDLADLVRLLGRAMPRDNLIQALRTFRAGSGSVGEYDFIDDLT